MLIDNFAEIEKLDEAIDKVLDSLLGADPGTEEYAKLADQLTKLMKIKETIATAAAKAHDAAQKAREFELTHTLKTDEVRNKWIAEENANAIREREMEHKVAESEKPDRVSKETLAVIGANLAGIVLVLGYERANVIASKAFSFIMKAR